MTLYIVLFGFNAAWFFAASPTKRSSSVNATTLGVIRLPNSFGIISTEPFLNIPTHEYVVPRSIPITGPSILLFSSLASSARIIRFWLHMSQMNNNETNLKLSLGIFKCYFFLERMIIYLFFFDVRGNLTWRHVSWKKNNYLEKN